MNGVANLALARQSRAGTIAFIDLKAQQARIRQGIERRLMAVLDHGKYIAGPEIEELEALLCERTGAAHCIACCSGTDALIMPMMALELSRHDAVFIPGFTYNATANAVLVAGGTPVFVDIDPATFNMAPGSLQAAIATARADGLIPRVVCAVDLFGAPADYPAISAIAAAEGMQVFADAAQSFGGRQGGKWVGNLAPVTGTSFFPGKALGAYGDAGATFTNDAAMAQICQSIRWHGTDEQRAQSVRVGINGRMSSFQAAVLLEKAAIFWDELEARRVVADIYESRLAGLVGLQHFPADTQSGYGYFTVAVDHRDAVREAMGTAGVPTAIYYKTPLHHMPAFAAYAPAGGLPVAEAASARVLSLPMHPYLTEAQAHFICDVLIAALTEARAAA